MRTNDSFVNWHVCLFWAVGAVATRERSIRRADGEPGKSSGHTEAHCYRERSTDATGKAYRCQTGKSLFLQHTDSLRCSFMLPIMLSFVCLFFWLGGSWKDSRLIFVALSLDHSSAVVYLVSGVNDNATSISSVTTRWFSLSFFLSKTLFSPSAQIHESVFYLKFPSSCVSVTSGSRTPSLTTGWCCSLQSCFRREAHVEVSHCSNTNRRPHTLKDTRTFLIRHTDKRGILVQLLACWTPRR